MPSISASVPAGIESLEPRQLMAAGDFDTHFNRTGIATAYFDAGTAPAGAGGAAAFQADGKLLMTEQRRVGSSTRVTLIRDNDNGTLDKTFAGGGVALPGAISQILVQSDGNVVVVGTTSSGGYIQRFNSSGTAIGFPAIKPNANGLIVFGSSLTAVAQSPGGYYVAGVFTNRSTGKAEPAVARLNTDGSFNTAFGKKGVLFLTVGGEPAKVRQLAVLTSGQIAVTGTTTNGLVSSAAFAIRLSATGALVNTDAAANNASQIAGLVATTDGRSVFQLATQEPLSASVRIASSTGSTIGNLFGASSAAEVSGFGGGLAVDGNGVISATLTNTAGRSVTLTQMDGAGSTANFQRTYTFGTGAAKVDAMRVIGDKLLIAVYDAGAVKETIARINLDSTRASGTSIIAGIVFDDTSGDGLRDAVESGIAGRTVYVDANNDGKFELGENAAVTDSAGYYQLKNLASRSFIIRDVLPAGITQTTVSSQTISIGAQDTFKLIKDFGTQGMAAPARGTPAAPADARAGVETTPSKAVLVKWTASKTATGHSILRRYRGESGWNTIATLTDGSTSYEDFSILNNVAYQYEITAFNSSGSAVSDVLQLHT